ncbi:hypothetical protein BCR44DRAFT_1449311, partial [Catenaria anguillulae PL171]
MSATCHPPTGIHSHLVLSNHCLQGCPLVDAHEHRCVNNDIAAGADHKPAQLDRQHVNRRALDRRQAYSRLSHVDEPGLHFVGRHAHLRRHHRAHDKANRCHATQSEQSSGLL